MSDVTIPQFRPATLPPQDRPGAGALVLGPADMEASYETSVAYPFIAIEDLVTMQESLADTATLRDMHSSLVVTLSVNDHPFVKAPFFSTPLRLWKPLLLEQGTRVVFTVQRHARGDRDRARWAAGEPWRLRVYAEGRTR